MRIVSTFSSISYSQKISFLQEKISSSVTSQNKRIRDIASSAFDCLTRCYIGITCCCFDAKYSLLNSLDDEDDVQELKQDQTPIDSENNKLKVYLKNVDLEPNCAAVYNNLARVLPIGESIQLLNGKWMTQKELFLKAIELCPDFATFYVNLGAILSPQESIQLPTGEEMTRQKLFLKAIELNRKAILDPNFTLIPKSILIPSSAAAFNNLAMTLSGEKIQLLDGEEVTKRDLLCIAIAHDPDYRLSYNNLGHILSSNERIQLLNGKWMTKQELLDKN